MQPAQLRVLLVEDDATARESLSQVLMRANYSVTAVEDGEQACDLLVERAAINPFDVVVTDLNLFEIDGLQVLRVAREQASPPEVIMLTGYGTLQTAIDALRAGAFDYLLKPYKPSELIECVGRAIERRAERSRRASAINAISATLSQLQRQTIAIEGYAPGESSAPGRPPAAMGIASLHIGDLVIDRYRQTITFAGELLHLTPIEYNLLRHLAEARGDTSPYHVIALATHDLNLTDNEAQQILKPHVYNLRRKITPDYIVNVRGVGYRLNIPDTFDPGPQ